MTHQASTVLSIFLILKIIVPFAFQPKFPELLVSEALSTTACKNRWQFAAKWQEWKRWDAINQCTIWQHLKNLPDGKDCFVSFSTKTTSQFIQEPCDREGIRNYLVPSAFSLASLLFPEKPVKKQFFRPHKWKRPGFVYTPRIAKMKSTDFGRHKSHVMKLKY